MKKILLILIVCFIGLNLFSQSECNTSEMANKIDSICTANNIKLCTIYLKQGSENTYSSYGNYLSEFKIDKYFIVIENKYYYNLSKLLIFNIYLNEKKPEKNSISFYFQ